MRIVDRPRIEKLTESLLLSGWARVLRIQYRLLCRDGRELISDRELLDRGDGVTVLLCNQLRRTVVLLRQARVAAAIRHGNGGLTIEACSGQVEGDDPTDTAMREIREETGQEITQLVKIGAVYAGPGASLEIVHLFLAFYDVYREGAGGGLAEEGEDIETMEVSIDQAMLWVKQGIICDGRTVLVLQHATLAKVFEQHAESPLPM